MSDRFSRGKSRLASHEQVLRDEKALEKKLGKVLPEDTVKIPKIGEWNLSSNTTIPTINTSRPKSARPVGVRPFPRDIPLSRDQQERLQHPEAEIIKSIPKTARQKATVEAPYKLRPPKSIVRAPERSQPTRVKFPEGTLTTDLNSIILSKHRETTQQRPQSSQVSRSPGFGNLPSGRKFVSPRKASPTRNIQSELTHPLDTKDNFISDEESTRPQTPLSQITSSRVAHPDQSVKFLDVNLDFSNLKNEYSISSTPKTSRPVSLSRSERSQIEENVVYLSDPSHNGTTFLPLEYFDDTTYEQYPISELMKDPHAWSRYQELNGPNYWARCTVLSYDEESGLFMIQWDSTQKRKKVARFNLRFDAEDIDLFNARIDAARENCHRFELAFRRNERIKQMPLETLPEISDVDMKDIINLLKIKITSDSQKLLVQLIEEVKSDFRFMNSSLAFDYEVIHNPLIPDHDGFMELIPQEPETPEYGLVCHTHFNFKERVHHLNIHHLLANTHVLSAITSVWGIFQDNKDLTFLSSGYPQVMQLNEFITKQYQEMTENARIFKSAIQDTLEGVIVKTINKDLGLSREQEKEKYSKVLTFTTYMLHTVLLSIVQNTSKIFLGIFTKYFDEHANLIPAQFQIDLTFSHDFSLDENSDSNENQKPQPISKNDNKLHFSPTIETFRDQILSLLIQLESTVMDLPNIGITLFDLSPMQIPFDDCKQVIQQCHDDMEKILDKQFNDLTSFLETYRHLEPSLANDPRQYAEQFDPDGTVSLAKYREKLQELEQISNEVQNHMHSTYKLGIFRVDCQSFKESAAYQVETIILALLTHLKQFTIHCLKEVQNEFETITDRIKNVPSSPEELYDLKNYVNDILEDTPKRAAKIQSVVEHFIFLEDFKFEISNEECHLKYQTLQMPHKLSIQLDETDRILQVERIKMIRELRKNQKQLETDIIQVTEIIPHFVSKYQDLDMTVEAVDQVNEIQQRLTLLKAQQEKYNFHEKLFNFEPGSNRLLTKLIEDFQPLHILWNLAGDWFNQNSTWLDLPFPQVKPDAMNTFMLQSNRKIQRLKKDLVQYPVLLKNVLNPLTEQIEKFKQNIPLISRLRHPGIKTKHWEQISTIVGFKVMPSLDMTLQMFLDLNLGRWNEQISTIASVAAQEYNIESSLDQMDNDLQSLIFQTKQFHDTEYFILIEIDDVVSIIDDQLVTTQTLLTSPYISPSKKRAIERMEYLRKSHKILDTWIECQRSWLYLQPIFTGTSIQQKLHREARDWNTVDKTWKSVMTQTHQHPEFNNVINRDHLLEDLESSNRLLDSITQGLNAYLESKRHGFPRFFFLSNDELITILSHTKDFDIIQKSMQKLFEYIASINVDEELQISAMNDDGLESVQLSNPVDGDTSEIEDWLNAFEEEMRATLRELIRTAVLDYPTKKREEWIPLYPAQVILISNQILWTDQVSTALQSRSLRGMKVLQMKFIEQLDQMTNIIRQQLTPAIRQTISCLLINEVHNRDIISSLIKEEVSDIDSFKWNVQLRYYLEEDTVMIRSINNTYEYSYEYAGNSSRLVITPLTDRCYQTLLSAFKQNLGGAPSGPAGTGKTETVRDCAKALGRSCVVYNCSEEVTPEQMSQFFAGLASSGSWSCFDEFNRINIEVLSVIAQQVRTIQEAISANAETFVLDQRTLKLNHNAAVCITMNPGYAGRTELPDNLKALFRPCAMMVPDFCFIAEILLFSGGFASASVLARKLVASFDLCRKQLSNAHHYDWGLRAMKAILTTAGKSKRVNLDSQEALLLVQSIKDCTRPRLISADIHLFDGILHDVFPDVEANKTISDDLERSIKSAFSSEELLMQPLSLYLSKCNEIYETMMVRHGIMLVGGAMGGKSVCWKALKIGMNKLAKDKNDIKIAMPVQVNTLNPKAISIPELYGLFDPITSGWSDGVLSKFIREDSLSDTPEWKWIIVDGPVDSLWIESMNSLLDDNKVLCLSNNERISLGANVKMMFEVDDLSEASPATVSRCGMIYFDPTSLPWTAIADSWVTQMITLYSEDENVEPDEKEVKDNKNNLKENKESYQQRENQKENQSTKEMKYPKKDLETVTQIIRQLMDKYIPQLIRFITIDGKVAIGHNELYCVQNLLKIVECYLDLLRRPVIIPASDGEEEKRLDPIDYDNYASPFIALGDNLIGYFKDPESLKAVFERVFMFAMIWSFGGVLMDESRPLFDTFIRELMYKNEAKCPIPQNYTVFDYCMNLSRMNWIKWTDGTTGIKMTADKSIEHQMIPTSESASMMFFSRLMVIHGKHILLHGPETSKSLSVKTLMENLLDQKKYDCKNLPFANCSTTKSVIQLFRSFLHKRHGVFGPLTNQKLVIFIDNFNSVKPEIYGAQPPLELIRQFMDTGGWYNTSSIDFERIVETTLIAAMGLEEGGLFSISQRTLRHFFLMHIPKYKKSIIQQIVTSLIESRFSGYQPQILEYSKTIAAASVDFFEKGEDALLPIPSKMHYIFSLRNIVRVINGMLLINPSDLSNEIILTKLWYHEMAREIYDRLNTSKDRSWFKETMNDLVSKHFKLKWNSIVPNNVVMFNSFNDHGQTYKENLSNVDQLNKKCKEMLDEYNREAVKPLDIVIFKEAAEHLSSLSRIFSLPRGHAMLVGVKSSGRRSLVHLALHMSSMEIFEVQITRTYGPSEWREDIKALMKQCGQNDLATAFVISDSQIIGSFQLEDISNLLINSEIQNLFERDDIDQIKAEMIQAELLTDEDPWQLFMTRVKRNLHIVLIFSPFGQIFKESILDFPALRTETTIDWYMSWSNEALESVGKASISKANNNQIDAVSSVVAVWVNMHKSVEETASKYFAETKRFTACTPSRYFELISIFLHRLKVTQSNTQEDITKYSNGVDKIESTKAQIQKLSEQLDHDIPILQQKRKKVEEMLNDLTLKQNDVEEIKQEVKAQSKVAEEEARQAAAANKVAQDKLNDAEPILNSARDAVDRMDKDSLVNIKQLKKIHPALRETFEAICIIFGKQPRKVESGIPGVKEDDYWPETLILINDAQFIKKVKCLEVENMSRETVNKLKKYVGANKEQRAIKAQAVQNGYQAVANLYYWVCASYDYWFVYQEILPLKIAADAAAQKLATSEAVLASRRAHLEAIEEQLNILMKRVNEEKKTEAELAAKVEDTKTRLDRAQKIISGLSGETKRWTECTVDLKMSTDFLLGDSLLIAGSMTYLGAFGPTYRAELLDKWKNFLKEESIKFSDNFSIQQNLGNDPTIREWIVQGLPNDSHSIENALIIENNHLSYPLFIDPQLSGTKWLRAVLGEKLTVLRFDQSDFVQRLKGCISVGTPVLIENVGLKLDPLIEPILSREYVIQDGMKKIAISGEYVNYLDSFRLFLSTKYPNPHYSPEVCSQVTLINFTTTEVGLSDLLMNSLIEVMRHDLDRKRIEIMETQAENTKKLKEAEDEILQIVSNSSSDILNDDTAIQTLQKAQKTSADINKQLAESVETEKLIESFRKSYFGVSNRASLLYFCASDFSVVDPMYQFSLKWFVSIFKKAVERAEQIDESVKSLNESIAKEFYEAVSFSLFSRHKLLFSVLLATRILSSEGKISSSELAFLISAEPKKISSTERMRYKLEEKPWLSEETLGLLMTLSSVSKVFNGIVEHVTSKENETAWIRYSTSNTPENEIPPFHVDLDFQKLLILRAFHLHRVREGLRLFISNSLGPLFITPPSLKLKKVFEDSSPLTPLIFIITPGIDPQDEILRVASSMELDKYMKSYSLGRGRGQGAEELILDSADRGFWVLLQNCHLSLSWMPKLEHIIEELGVSHTVHSRFRLCLVTMSSDEFPIGILYQGTKLIYEIPKGIRENVTRIYNGFNPDEYDKNLSSIEKQLTFRLAFFHAIVLERLQFGSLGWNIPYEFNPSDFDISLKHLKSFLADSDGIDVPYEALSYVIGELNYGGRVTDHWDRRLLLSLLQKHFSESANQSGPHYPEPDYTESLFKAEEVISKWPVQTSGEDVGLSMNASTISACNDANRIFNSLIEIQPTLMSSGSTADEDSFALSHVQNLLRQVPEPLKEHQFTSKFNFHDIIDTVLLHDVEKYNRLLNVILKSLKQLERALKGLIVMDQSLELLNKRLLSNKIPELWLEYSFPSILTLRCYMDDLKMRIDFLNNWLICGRPIIFKLGAFFHPEEFLTAVLQVYARKYSLPFDNLGWSNQVMSMVPKRPPEDGIYVEGLAIEGAKWDVASKSLTECRQREIISFLPIVHLLPKEIKDKQKLNDDVNKKNEEKMYECPMYRMQNRGTGALDLPNYLMNLYLPSAVEQKDHWIQRSVAVFVTVQH